MKRSSVTSPLLDNGSKSRFVSDARGLFVKMFLPAIALFAVLAVSIVFLIWGSVVFSHAQNRHQILQDTLNTAITSYNTTDLPLLNYNSTFVAKYETQQSYQMNVTSDPFFNPNKFEGSEYYDPIIVFTHMLINGDWSYGPEKTLNIEITSNITKMDQYKTEVSVPAWMSNVSAPFTSNKIEELTKECLDSGGAVEDQKCIRYYIVNYVCVKMQNNGTLWSVDGENGGPGCEFPFKEESQYTQVRLSNGSRTPPAFEVLPINVYVRSSLDPYIILQEMTSGNGCLNDFTRDETDKAKHLLSISLVLFILTVVFFGLLICVRKVIKLKIGSDKGPLNPFVFLAIAAVGAGSFLGVGLPLLGHWSEEGAWFSYVPFWGYWFAVLGAPICLFGLVTFWGLILRSEINPVISSSISLVTSVLVFIGAGYLVHHHVQPWKYDLGTDPEQQDALSIYLAVFAVMVAVPLAVMNVWVVIRNFLILRSNATTKWASPSMNSDNYAPVGPVQKDYLPIIMVVVSIVVLMIAFLATCILPPIFNVPLTGYYTSVSPYSLIDFRASGYDLGWFGSNVVPKVYLDVVVFYGSILFMIAASAALLSVRATRKFLHKTFVLWYFKVGNDWRVEISVGELFFLAWFVLLNVWWFWYWFSHYDRIAQITDQTERLARTFGHMTNLMMALIVLPVTRNSMWPIIIGIPFERAIRYHRIGGVILLIQLTLHCWTWWVRMAQHGQFWESLYAIQNPLHKDNWSIVLVQLTWLGVAIMVFMSHPYIRRKYFEVFFYTHHFFAVFFIVALMHSWSLWYFLGGGLLIWFVDRLIRFGRGTTIYPVMSLASLDNGEITQINIRANFPFSAGQYCFLNVPEISPVQWHPFSISSSPGDNALTFHIKNMGPKTWTGRLSAKFTQMKYFGGGANPSISIDGPYGNPPNFQGRHSVFLLAGGIGITPVMSIFRDLAKRANARSAYIRPGSFNVVTDGNLAPTDLPRVVTMLWVARDIEMVKAFKTDLDFIVSSSTSRTRFDIRIFITRSSINLEKVEEFANFNMQRGRPVLDDELRATQMPQLIFVCGPAPLVDDARRAAHKHSFEFHAETFEL